MLYGQETWSSSSLHKIETLYRKAIKLTFNISLRAPNEIIYIETGFYELKAEIYRAQYKFWSKIKNDIAKDPNTSVAKLFKADIERNVQYLRHYKNLHKNFQNEDECFKHYTDTFIANLRRYASYHRQTQRRVERILGDLYHNTELLALQPTEWIWKAAAALA